MWPDNETTQDLIGFKVHVKLIQSLVVDEKLLPLTIGIFGDWGGGKTSIMKMLEKDLDPDNCKDQTEKEKYERIGCLYFNGWQFEGYDDAKSAILSSVLLQLGEHKRFGPKVRDKITALLKSVNWMRLARLGLKEVAMPAVLAYLTGGASLIPSLAASVTALSKDITLKANNDKAQGKKGALEENSLQLDWEGRLRKDKTPASPLDVRTFRARFSELIKECDIDSLVVLIDDLDRCSPERIVDNLEAIKLFLNVDHTAFVIGADPRIVRHAIAIRYKHGEIPLLEDFQNEEEKERLVTDYLEKLIQVPYQLPRLSPSEIETYMTLLFCLQDLNGTDARKCLEAYEKGLEKNRYLTFGYAEVKEALEDSQVPNSLSKSLILCTAVAPLITEGLKGNPRQVKRFLNAFIIRKELAQIANLQNIQDEVLVKLMVLEYGHPNEFYQLFEWQSEQNGFPKQIQVLENALLSPNGELDIDELKKNVGQNWSTSFIRKWILMEPRLNDVDLRDYFWVARDRLHSTLSGLSLVSPIIRRLHEDLISDSPPRRKAAINTTRELTEEERTSLFDLITRHIISHPDQLNGFNAIFEMINEKILDATETLLNILNKCPPDLINPAIGVDLFTLIYAREDLRKIFDPELERLASGKTKIGRAIKKRINKKVS